MKNIIYLFVIVFFTSCGGGGGDTTLVQGYTREDPITSSDKTVLMADEFSQYQWHRNKLDLDNLNLTYAGYNNGNPIIVQVTDDGIEADHEDLYYNMNFSSSYNASNNSNDPTPSSGNYHGTQVAGVIGAIGYNNLGLKGIAPSANLAGFAFETINGYLSYSSTDISRAWLDGDNANNIAISNNSWGSCVSRDTAEEEILKAGTEILRDRKGRIYLFAGGNERGDTDPSCPNATSNGTYLNNSQYTIAVAAVNENDEVASYSSPGANILVSGYSGENYLSAIGTTVPEGTSLNYETWNNDVDRNYTDSFSGTSASTPFVSGALALVLEACPDLTYRDVKYLIANNSTKVDSTNSSWITNAAGFIHSSDYGFGVINPQGMIDECTTNTFASLGEKLTSSVEDNTSSSISTSTLTKTLYISDDLTLEWVGLTVTSYYSNPENVEIVLVSPSGTRSELIHFDNQFEGYSSFFKLGFRLSSQAFMGESALGDWTVEITSNSSSGSGTLRGLSLEVVGH